MTSINLATKEEIKPANSLGKEWAACIVVMVLLLLIYIGLVFYNNFLTEKTDSLVGEYDSQSSALMESGKNVFDFQNRLAVAGPLILKKNYALESLDQIEKMIIPGVYAESFLWDSGAKDIALECVANEYRLVANQLASLKKSDYFSEVIVNKTASRDDGKISFLLKLTIKNKK